MANVQIDRISFKETKIQDHCWCLYLEIVKLCLRNHWETLCI